jgi:hypothetical protein
MSKRRKEVAGDEISFPMLPTVAEVPALTKASSVVWSRRVDAVHTYYDAVYTYYKEVEMT